MTEFSGLRIQSPQALNKIQGGPCWGRKKLVENNFYIYCNAVWPSSKYDFIQVCYFPKIWKRGIPLTGGSQTYHFSHTQYLEQSNNLLDKLKDKKCNLIITQKRTNTDKPVIELRKQGQWNNGDKCIPYKNSKLELIFERNLRRLNAWKYIFIDLMIKQCKDGNSNQVDLWIQCNLN